MGSTSKRMGPPDAKLWELLDVWGIPFRMTLGELVARYGSWPSDLSDGCDVCRVAARSPLDPFLATSWADRSAHATQSRPNVLELFPDCFKPDSKLFPNWFKADSNSLPTRLAVGSRRARKSMMANAHFG